MKDAIADTRLLLQLQPSSTPGPSLLVKPFKFLLHDLQTCGETTSMGFPAKVCPRSPRISYLDLESFPAPLFVSALRSPAGLGILAKCCMLSALRGTPMTAIQQAHVSMLD